MRRLLTSLTALLAGTYVAASLLGRLRAKRFDGQVVVISGGSRGLGLAIAREFDRRGARLALLARDANELARAQEQLAAEGAQVVTLQGDVRDYDDARRAVERVVELFGRVDVLVNDAGTIAVGPMETMTREDYVDALSTHFWGTYNMVEAAWGALCRSGGSVVNITSIGGRLSVPHLLPYSVSKFAQVGYSEGLCAEAARFGIKVTTVTPGLMRTGSPRNAWFKGNNRAEYAWFHLSDAMPLLSVSASYAARRIVDACALGEANVSIGPAAFWGTRIHGLSPGITMRAMRLAAALLPKANGAGTMRHRGTESESGITASALTLLSRKAEREYNQL
jgi:NAD(P)-dependent dehydrogenase (short-subunit alcohol dehydrogenase family)